MIEKDIQFWNDAPDNRLTPPPDYDKAMIPISKKLLERYGTMRAVDEILEEHWPDYRDYGK